MKQISLIAMKGAPFTRKTEISTLIATSLSCPLLSLDDFLDIMHPDQVQISPLAPQDLGFKIICRIAESHLSKGVCDNIVIDSPLLSRAHLDQLIELAESLNQTRLVIVECKPDNVYSWQMEFDEYVDRNPQQFCEWYKAKNWDDITNSIKNYYDETLEYGSRVSKLMLDPIWDHLQFSENEQAIRPVTFLSYLSLPKHLKKVSVSDHQPPLMEAVKYMITRKKGNCPDVVVYRQWLYSKDRHSNTCNDNESGKQVYYCTDGHTITKYMEIGFDESEVVNCIGCGKEVTGLAYTCNNCILALHKECAENFGKGKGMSKFLHYFLLRSKYTFLEKFGCMSCKENEKPFSDDCMSCLFETNLKCHLMPTVLRHDCEEHFLSLVLLPDEYDYPESYKCLACGNFVSQMFYSCKICSVCYHFNCLVEINRRVKDEHGGHHHHIQLKFSCKEAEDYICDECLERRDPQLWFYSCEDCKYEVHLDCIFRKKRKPLNFVRAVALASMAFKK